MYSYYKQQRQNQFVKTVRLQQLYEETSLNPLNEQVIQSNWSLLALHMLFKIQTYLGFDFEKITLRTSLNLFPSANVMCDFKNI